MANPQTEDGFVRIQTEVMIKLCKTRIPGEARQVLDFIIRKTWGFNKKYDPISLSQFVEGTGIRKQAVCRALTKLLKMALIIKKENALATVYSVNKDYDLWLPLSKKITTISLSKKGRIVPQKDNRRSPKRVESLSKKRHTIDILKDNTTIDKKDTATSLKRFESYLKTDFQKIIDIGRIYKQDCSDQYRIAWIKGETRKMKAWLIANPKKANKKNWGQFINNWLQKAKDQSDTGGGMTITQEREHFAHKSRSGESTDFTSISEILTKHKAEVK